MNFAIINDNVSRLKITKELANDKVEIESQYGVKKILNKSELMSKKEADEKMDKLEEFNEKGNYNQV